MDMSMSMAMSGQHNRAKGGGVTAAVAIFGDSTAAFSGASEFAYGWGWMFAKDPTLQWEFYGSGVGGETSAQMLARVAADTDHRDWPTILMDRPNTGETAAEWIANMKSAVGYLRSPRWLVVPPVQDAPDTGISNITDAQALLLSDPVFTGHTFDASMQADYKAALNTASTRVGGGDNVHFNDLGQAIQALFISAFYYQQGWRVETSELTNLLPRLSALPSTKRRGLMNALIERQKRAGLFASYDAFYMLAAETAQDAALNWVGNSFGLTIIGIPTFAADRGYTGNGGTARLNTGFDPVLAPSPKFVKASSRMTVFPVTDVAESVSDMGSTTRVTGSTRISTRNADNSQTIRMNAAADQFRAGGGASKMLFGIARDTSDNVRVEFGGAGTFVTNPASDPAGGNILILGETGGNTKQVSSASIGGYVADAIASRDHFSRTAYLKAIGVPI